MKKVILIIVALVCMLFPWQYVICTGAYPGSALAASMGACVCHKCRASYRQVSTETEDGWQQGEFITYRKTYAHSCGGTLTFNGKTDRAPYSESDVFYTHVCDKCSVTNQMLNAHWPQFKREWRSK